MEAAGGMPGSARTGMGREDCWSEGATAALIQAWGDRHLELNRGNLKQKHWQEVAEEVNSRPGAARIRRTDVQCKNRIDTLKKKYKAEKARVLANPGTFVSKWPYYGRIDELIGPASGKKASASPPSSAGKAELPLALPLPYRGANLPVAAVRATGVKEKRPAAEDEYVFRRIPSPDTQSGSSRSKSNPDSGENSRESEGKSVRGNGEGIRELARAIMRFGEIYEKVESAKQRQMMELERQRMEFVKGLEFQRMQIYMDSQVELAKMKKAKRGNTGRYL